MYVCVQVTSVAYAPSVAVEGQAGFLRSKEKELQSKQRKSDYFNLGNRASGSNAIFYPRFTAGFLNMYSLSLLLSSIINVQYSCSSVGTGALHQQGKDHGFDPQGTCKIDKSNV